MKKWAYYNEVDPYCCEWIRNLINAGLITDGEIDSRSIVDVRPDDVRNFVRCHWFSGIAVWDYALGLAGWPVGRPIWTGSCPCQPFSSAGRRAGFADDRHLWPVWFDLIRECRPDTLVGEQVEAAVRLGWLDAVFADLEGEDYACGAVVLGAHSVGAPHIRQRLWFVANANGERSYGRGSRSPGRHEPAHSRRSGGLGDAERIGLRSQGCGPDAGAPGGMPHQDGQRERLRADIGAAGGVDPWSDLIWLSCRDGKARPTQPGLQPLVDGAAFKLGSGSTFEGRSRVGMLRCAGNAINAKTAAEFLAAALSATSPCGSDLGGRA